MHYSEFRYTVFQFFPNNISIQDVFCCVHFYDRKLVSNIFLFSIFDIFFVGFSPERTCWVVSLDICKLFWGINKEPKIRISPKYSFLVFIKKNQLLFDLGTIVKKKNRSCNNILLANNFLFVKYVVVRLILDKLVQLKLFIDISI